MYHASFMKCPQCGSPFEIRMFGFYSGLGPSTVKCSKCQTQIGTERNEWLDMSSRQRVVFLIVSAIYVFALGLIGGNFVDAMYQLSRHVRKVENLRLGSSEFQRFSLACAIAAILIQTYRIAGSVARTKTGRTMTTKDFWIGLQMNMQFKCLAGLVLLWLLANAVYA